MLKSRGARLGGHASAVSAIVVLLATMAPSAVGGTNTQGGVLPASDAKTDLVDDPVRVAAKEQGSLRRSGNVAMIQQGPALPASNADPSKVLPYLDIAGKIVETEGNQYDDSHQAFTDRNYWNFCMAGAATVAVYYWKVDTFLSFPAGNFTEPYGPHSSTTFWRSSDTGTSSDTSNGYATKGRNYEMYLAEKVKPPTFATPGIINFSVYPTNGGTIPDMRDGVNWEQTGHAPDWQTWAYYVYHQGPGTQTELVNHVKQDVFWDDAPVVVILMTKATVGGTTYHLPNWDHAVAHAVTIVGYDDTTSKFTYIDTLGTDGNGSPGNHNGGTYTVSYTTMFKLIQAHGDGYMW
jgi:hypothetical protein